MTPQRLSKISIFEALRGLLACWVLFAHVGLFAGITPGLSGALFIPSYFNITAGHAVEVFMTLSGFVIFFLLQKSQESYGVFIFRRLCRLYPVFLLCLLIGILLNPMHQYVLKNVSWSAHPWVADQLELAQNDHRFMWQHIGWHLPMFHGAIPDNVLPRADGAFSGPSWSISTEWQFYLIAPLAFAAYRRRNGFLMLSAVALLWPFVPGLFPAINNGHPIRAMLLTQFGWFYIGMSSFVIYQGPSKYPYVRSKLFYAVFGLMLIYFALFCRMWFAIPIWLLFFATVHFSAIHEFKLAAPLIRILNSSVLQYVGKVSYPVYLLHWPALVVVLKLMLWIAPTIDRVPAYGILLVAVPALTFACAHFVHLFIEQPAIDLGRRLSRRDAPILATQVAELDSKVI